MSVATRKWLTLVVDILAYEIAHWRDEDEEMLSHAVHRAIERNPIAARVAIILAGALLTAHLAKIIAPEVDPLSRDFRLRNRRRSR